jgi:hypothetical protein
MDLRYLTIKHKHHETNKFNYRKDVYIRSLYNTSIRM